MALSMQENLLNFILWPIFLFLIVLLSPLIILAFTVRSLEAWVYHFTHGAKVINIITSFWTNFRKQKGCSGDINGYMIVDGIFPLVKFKSFVSNVFNLQHSNGKRVYWNTRTYVKSGFINNYWVKEKCYDICDHVRQYCSEPISSEEELKKIISTGSIMKNPKRSPWDLRVIPYIIDGHLKTVIHFSVWHGMVDSLSRAYHLFLLRITESEALTSQPIKSAFAVGKSIWSLPSVLIGMLLRKKDVCLSDDNNWTFEECLNLETTSDNVLLACCALSFDRLFKNINECLSSIVSLNKRLNIDEVQHMLNKISSLIIELPRGSVDMTPCLKDGLKS